MPLALDPLRRAPLPPGTKGLPPGLPAGFAAADIAGRGWNLLRGDVPLPAAVLRRSHVAANIAAMQSYLAERGALLAPHGKTTLCPELFARQIDAGAWGITVANVQQLALCHATGVDRVLIANEVVGDAELDALARMAAERPAAEYIFLVDSIAGADQAQAAFARAGGAGPAQVLVEIGFAGGRCGVRSIDAALALAAHVRRLDRLSLRGIEGYEGLLLAADGSADPAATERYLDSVCAAAGAIAAEGLFDVAGGVILSAGGSVYYDMVVDRLARSGLDGARVVIRSGCYVAHDHGFYARHHDQARARATSGAPPALAPALELWARVLSRPEPDLAILSAGKRDLSFDIDLPVADRWFRPGHHAAPERFDDGAVFSLSDQHAFLRLGPSAPAIAVGDVVILGISHPCTTFDRWPLLLEVDDAFTVVVGLRTCF
ncbi:alanine racemase [Sphingomonas flavalba]|uniref:alanine racemase n=1 Tax=Sphingomonas flavalba TaxID=2559804 RepID=UPI00109DE84C|nr:alanine racemase [Sphingomonas flavalba]